MKAVQWEAVRRVLAISVQGIGNTLLALPALCDLKRHAPGVRLTLVVGDPRQAALFALADPVDRALAVPRDARGRLAFALRLRRERFDLTLVTFPHGPASAWLAFLAGGRSRTGHVDGSLHAAGRRLYHHRVPIDRGLHDVAQNRRLVAVHGVPPGDDHRCPFRFPEDAMQRVRALFRADRPVLSIHPGGTPAFPEKNWLPERFGETARILADRHGLLPVVLFGPGEMDLARAVVAASGGRAVKAPELGLVETAVFIARSRLFLGSDCGMSNLAVSLGVPTVMVQGPSEPTRSAPLGRHSRLVRADLPCAPCWSLDPWPGCRFDRALCMEAVSAEQAAEAASELLAAEEDGAT